jgi:PAB1-binding protein PBP1
LFTRSRFEKEVAEVEAVAADLTNLGVAICGVAMPRRALESDLSLMSVPITAAERVQYESQEEAAGGDRETETTHRTDIQTNNEGLEMHTSELGFRAPNPKSATPPWCSRS